MHLVEEQFRNDVMGDIDVLQLSQTSDIFDKALKCFVKKCKLRKVFIDYKNEKWFTTHKNWYKGVGSRLESQNNGLEAFNNVIKKEVTLRERLPLGRYLNLCLETCERL